MIGVRQDMHVHSTFSDGRDTIEDNVAEAERLGLLELTCVDHVRAGHRVGTRLRRHGAPGERHDACAPAMWRRGQAP